MLCSARELGLSDEHAGLLILPEDASVGADIRDYLRLNDAIIDIDLTPNRADCFSMLGLAREIAQLCRANWARITVCRRWKRRGRRHQRRCEADH